MNTPLNLQNIHLNHPVEEMTFPANRTLIEKQSNKSVSFLKKATLACCALVGLGALKYLYNEFQKVPEIINPEIVQCQQYYLACNTIPTSFYPLEYKCFTDEMNQKLIPFILENVKTQPSILRCVGRSLLDNNTFVESAVKLHNSTNIYIARRKIDYEPLNREEKGEKKDNIDIEFIKGCEKNLEQMKNQDAQWKINQAEQKQNEIARLKKEIGQLEENKNQLSAKIAEKQNEILSLSTGMTRTSFLRYAPCLDDTIEIFNEKNELLIIHAKYFKGEGTLVYMKSLDRKEYDLYKNHELNNVDHTSMENWKIEVHNDENNMNKIYLIFSTPWKSGEPLPSFDIGVYLPNTDINEATIINLTAEINQIREKMEEAQTQENRKREQLEELELLT